MVFSKPLPRKVVAERLKKLSARKVTILACPYCASLSLAIQNKGIVYDPFIKLFGTAPIEQEANGLKRHLEDEGLQVDVWGNSFRPWSFCIPMPPQIRAIRSHAEKNEAMVMLMCKGGQGMVRKIAGNRCQLVPGMESTGCFGARFSFVPPYKLAVSSNPDGLVAPFNSKSLT